MRTIKCPSSGPRRLAPAGSIRCSRTTWHVLTRRERRSGSRLHRLRYRRPARRPPPCRPPMDTRHSILWHRRDRRHRRRSQHTSVIHRRSLKSSIRRSLKSFTQCHLHSRLHGSTIRSRLCNDDAAAAASDDRRVTIPPPIICRLLLCRLLYWLPTAAAAASPTGRTIRLRFLRAELPSSTSTSSSAAAAVLLPTIRARHEQPSSPTPTTSCAAQPELSTIRGWWRRTE